MYRIKDVTMLYKVLETVVLDSSISAILSRMYKYWTQTCLAGLQILK